MSETHCIKCGTRLLLVVFPHSLQYDTNQVPSYYEDHLLERVSLLELRLAQLTEALHGALEVIREQGAILREEKEHLKSLYQMIGLIKTEEAEKSKSARDSFIQQKLLNESGAKPEKKEEEIFGKIIAGHDLPNIRLFRHILEEAVRLLAQNEEKQGFKMLERALLLSPQNLSLHLFTAEKLFWADKFDEARTTLEKALQFAPGNSQILLILGAIYADEAAAEKARKFLGLLVNDESKTLIVNFMWGMLAAFEENWTESIAAFRQAQEQEELPELAYLIGCAYYQLDRLSMALQYFQKAVRLQEDYADAWFMQSLIYGRNKDQKREKETLEKAVKINENGAQCLEFLKGKKLKNPEIALPFRHFRQPKMRILTNGAVRLTKFFRAEIKKSIK